MSTPRNLADRYACDEGRAYGRAAALSRRTMLKGLGGAVVTLMATESVHTQVAMAAPGYSGDVLVVLSLRGGFDGLSAVVPGGDPAYYALRPTIGVPRSRLLQLDGTFGFHPALRPLLPLWQNRSLAVVHGVGAPDPTRSHFSAMAEMERAAPGTSLRTGWLDRTLGVRGTTAEQTFAAVQVGSTTTPQSLAGPAPELATNSLSSFGLVGPRSDGDRTRWSACLAELHATGPDTVAAPGRAALAAATRLRSLPAASAPGYPDSDLGRSLADVARLVNGGVGVQVATVDCGDWDMHEDLGKAGDGWMAAKLTDLAQALVAFAADLGPRMSGTTVVTMSEFGRRAGENGSAGLDHGHGNAMFVLGGGVNGGKVYGRWPGLGEQQLVDGALAGTTDYRSVIGEVLTRRCGAGSLGEIFPGLGAATTLGVVRSR
ncbi:DUF1501 domain-containing protein [Kineococcus sp. SYSU DK006]|uniref:DUF1501 domain-containing protein n=1 Tax=Kineococcus sp. SYSU DK006 TaxID=3383127 RepID=UPI003D7C77E7